MKKIKLNLGKRSYEIISGQGALSRLSGVLKKLKPGKVAIVVTNPTINRIYGSLIQSALKGSGAEVHLEQVPDAERSKSAAWAIKLIEKIAVLDRGKGAFIIAFGGGVIGDLAGFCASVYRRGVPYIQVPTTLLAQVDSSIGGKVAIDLRCGKNLVGSFYQPQLVLSDTKLLQSLPLEQIKQALAEIIKYAVISDSGFFSFLEKNLDKLLKLEQKTLEQTIERCAKIKAKIVEQDEADKKDKRIILNFGHTIGHALEAAGGYSQKYSHGNAVALGMLVACEIAKEKRLLSSRAVKRIEALIKRAGLPTVISGLKVENILKAQQHDKKFRKGKNRFVLPARIGKVVVKENIAEATIVKAIKSRIIRDGSA